jgi:type II secretory pathway pseudopilin PulG
MKVGRGFLLLELMIALGIFAGIGLFTARLLVQVISWSTRTQRTIQAVYAASSMLERMMVDRHLLQENSIELAHCTLTWSVSPVNLHSELARAGFSPDATTHLIRVTMQARCGGADGEIMFTLQTVRSP